MASDPQTWAELKTAVERWLVRDDQTANIAEFIALAERRFNRTVFSIEREGSTTLTAAPTVPLPADFWGIKSLWVDSDPKVSPGPLSLNELRDKYASSVAGIPCDYAISGLNLVLGPEPDSAYDLPLSYWKTIPALGASQADNWLLLNHPDLYLAGALVEAFLAAADESRAQIWDQRTEAKIAEVNGSGQRKRHSGSPVRWRSRRVV